MMHKSGFEVINYVDDFVRGAMPSIVQHSYELLGKLLYFLGIDVSDKRLIPPWASRLTWLKKP